MTADSIFTGNVVAMKVTNPLHYGNIHRQEPAADDVTGSFAQMLNSMVNRVNNLQVDAEEMAETMIHAPESVDIHTVMIAQQKAEVSLTFAKAVRDEAIRAYREIINLR